MATRERERGPQYERDHSGAVGPSRGRPLVRGTPRLRGSTLRAKMMDAGCGERGARSLRDGVVATGFSPPLSRPAAACAPALARCGSSVAARDSVFGPRESAGDWGDISRLEVGSLRR